MTNKARFTTPASLPMFKVENAHILSGDGAISLTNATAALDVLATLLDAYADNSLNDETGRFRDGDFLGLVHIIRLISSDLDGKVYGGLLPLQARYVQQLLDKQARPAAAGEDDDGE